MTHSELVINLVKSGTEIADSMSGLDAHLIHMVLGISGESGELLDAVKKSVIYNQALDIENIVEELGDIEFFLEGFRQGLHITREECLAHNIAKLMKRYEKGYSDAAAKARADKI